MKINLTAPILDLKDMPVLNEGVALMLGEVCCGAVLAPLPDEIGTSVKRFRIAQKLTGGDEVDLSAEDISELKRLIQKWWVSPIVVGRALDLLDPPTA